MDELHRIRPHKGQIQTAERFRMLLDDSELMASYKEHVQDPYSFRCIPQVHGASKDTVNYVASVFSAEINAVTDNPTIFPDIDVIVSGGNFHAEPVAMVADYLAIAIAEIGSLSERRIALLIDSHLSELPAFLVAGSGLNSGFMMAQVTAAALVSENKTLAHPASVDSIPTSANQEDHVSMAAFAGRRLHEMLDNVDHVVAIELLAAAQGVEFHRPKKSSVLLEKAMQQVRNLSAAYTEDRSLSPDVQALAVEINQGEFCQYGSTILPSFAE